jgi:CheY-like chemotaxis protein
MPDVIVLDLGLPRIYRGTPRKDELQMLAMLRSIRLTRSVPIVALSDDPDSTDDALEEGATECIDKSRTRPRDLAREIDELMDRLQ